MSFFSKLKEKATAVKKAAENYVSNEESKAQGGKLDGPEYKVKPIAGKDKDIPAQKITKDNKLPQKSETVDPLTQV